MKSIYHIAESVTFESGGLRTVVENLDNYINKETDYASVVVVNHKEKTDPYLDFPTERLRFWNYSSAFKNHLSDNVAAIDLLHIHGVFMHAHYATSKLSGKHQIPYVVTPHGMLEPWHLNDKRLKKKIYLALLLNDILAKSKILHAITPSEKDNLYKLCKHRNIVEIPNFIHYSELPQNLGHDPQEDYLLFLSRIHPKKGLDILLQSMSEITNKTIKLKIVGTQNSYAEELKKTASKLGIDNRIEFVGGVYGDEKYKLFANARAFVAPSYSEAIGMVNLEAAACKTPVITSFETGISPEWNNNGGIMINPKADELTSAINQVTQWTAAERNERGIALSDFVVQNYSWEKKGHLWKELYDAL